MSYIQYPRLHFSGKFKASPSTINNSPNNYDPLIYPEANDLNEVELYWNPKGDGGFDLVDCVVTRVDYAAGDSTTDPAVDPIIGQPVTAVKTSFPLSAAMVDLDPCQQNVSEIWALNIQIGDSTAHVLGAFSPIAFYAIWGQCQSSNAPRSSASGSGVYQSKLTDIKFTGDTTGSRFLQGIKDNGSSDLSVNFNVNQHNNSPPIYAFTEATFLTMGQAPDAVSESVLTQLMPMQEWFQNYDPNCTTPVPACDKLSPGNIPTQEFVLYMLKQLLSVDDFNASVDKIIACSKTVYSHISGSPGHEQILPPSEFTYGVLTGTAGESASASPNHFVPTRMLTPVDLSSAVIYFTPFVTSADGKTITLNFGNSLPTATPNYIPNESKLGALSLVAFNNDEVAGGHYTILAQIPYTAEGFITEQSGFFTYISPENDYSRTQLGLVSHVGGTSTILAQEHPEGYYMRADQFVFRMNPGEATSPENLRGGTATANIHVLQWGQPVGAGTEIEVNQMQHDAAYAYTSGTLGTGGTKGVKQHLCEPQDVLSLNGTKLAAGDTSALTITVATNAQGVAVVDLLCSDPGNPRGYVDGQVYFLEYQFSDPSIQSGFIQDINDKISVLVFDETSNLDGDEVLAKWGRLYKIMGFLTDEEKVTEISFRNVIKQMLEKPFSEIKHMPLTRDLGKSARSTVVDWINALNNSENPPS